MPEGDTVYRWAAELHQALAGRPLIRAELRVPRYAATDLTGHTVHRVSARGKHLLIDIGSLTVNTHAKMEGVWHIQSVGARWSRPAHRARVVLATESIMATGFDLGLVRLAPTEQIARTLSDLGPDPLGPGWDEAEAIRRLGADPTRTIGEALLDQHRIAGLGNVYRCELCFMAGLHPATLVAAADLPALVDLAYRAIIDNVGRRVRVFTAIARPGFNLWVYGRHRQPCRRCGALIHQGRLGGADSLERAIWWCPSCQPRYGGS